MKILITGSNGYISQKLIEKCNQKNKHFFYGVDIDSSICNFNNYLHIKTDITTDNFLEKIPTDIDLILHFAQSSYYRNFPEKANDIFNVNVKSTQYLLNWALKNNIKHFLFCSTGNVYKNDSSLKNEIEIPQPESYYGASKYMSEVLIGQYKDFFSTTILRLFGIYGPKQKNMLIPTIIDKIMNNETISLANNEGIWLTPIFIDDCIDCIIKLIDKKDDKFHNVFNIAGDEILSLKSIIDSIENKVNKKANIKITANNPMYLKGCNKQLKLYLKINKFIEFNDGITKTLQNV